LGAVIGALTDAFRPGSSFPPAEPSDQVHFFAGEGPAMAAWNAHTDQPGCDEPFLWVRIMRRYRTQSLPNPTTDTNPCSWPRAVAVEVGVGRCAVTEENPDWSDYELEAATSLEDSWRIEQALCVAAARLQADHYTVALDEIAPYGPEGGVVAWTGILYIQLD
jgi:hypothetical protein